ncbi:transposase [Bacillus subtilis subsp. subtilis]|nr:transposase [Bacillus sp. DM2]MBA4562840.1 transposase [Bacillus subtilis subsp. subtilis]MBF8228418.1 transposase [Bacillus subtilis]MDR4256602.1 transposase [Bacillus subtilis subsp. subtilis NCIB 3610 = ATCC 6051 = DSM 10]QDW08041.1 transposase [Bacillus sp. KBS0812]
MMFIGYLYGIRAERQLKKEIYYNMSYRMLLFLFNGYMF